MKNKIYTGSTKTLYQKNPESSSLIMAFNDTIKNKDNQAINVPGKGVITNSISAYIMTQLRMIGIKNHFIEKLNMREQLIQIVDVFPVQVNVCVVACSRYVSDFQIEEGFIFDRPIIDFRISKGNLNYPPINEHQMLAFDWLSDEDIAEIKLKALRIFDFLTGLFSAVGIRLLECNLEFGRTLDDEDFGITLIDEISPDTCRLWDMKTNRKLSFDCITEDGASPHDHLEAYQEVLRRFKV